MYMHMQHMKKNWEELTEEDKNALNWTSVATEEELKGPGADAKKNNLSFFVKKGRELDPDAKGYADANYDLTITIEFVQPTEDAVTEAWGSIGFDQVKDLVARSSANCLIIRIYR